MKHHVSRFIKTVSIFYLAFPVAYVVLSAILFDIPAGNCMTILLSPYYYALTVLAMVAGYGFWEMKRWAWYLFLVVNVLVAYTNVRFVYEFGVSQHKVLAFAISLFALVIMTYRVAREIRVPYFFPKIRWWESNPRYRLSVPVRVGRASGDPFDAQILDLSITGCFVKVRHDLTEEEPVKLSFTVFGQVIECLGTVVWRTQSTVTHPKGVGIKFAALARPQKRALRVVNQRLKKIAVLYRRKRYLLNQDEFLKRLEEIETSPARQRRALRLAESWIRRG